MAGKPSAGARRNASSKTRQGQEGRAREEAKVGPASQGGSPSHSLRIAAAGAAVASLAIVVAFLLAPDGGAADRLRWTKLSISSRFSNICIASRGIQGEGRSGDDWQASGSSSVGSSVSSARIAASTRRFGFGDVGGKLKIVHDEDIEALREWIVGKGAMVSDAVGVGVAPSGLRGIVATRHVAANETLFVITKEVILSSGIAFRGDMDDGEGAAGNATWDAARLYRYPRSEQWDFGLYVARQRLRGTKSKWYPYIKTLPKRPPSVWCASAEELKPFKEASLIGQKKYMRFEDARSGMQDRAKKIFAEPAVQSYLFDKGTYEDLLWGVSMVTSRTFAGDTGSDESEDSIMTPMMDLLNHHWSGSTMIWDSRVKSATLKASRDLEPGDEIYVNYGEKGSLETILAYGFAAPSNPYETYDLTVAIEATYRPELFQRASALGFWGANETGATAMTVTEKLRVNRLPSKAIFGFARCVHVGSSAIETLPVEAFAGDLNLGIEIEKYAIKLIISWIEEGLRGAFGSDFRSVDVGEMQKKALAMDSYWAGAAAMWQTNLGELLLSVEAKLRQLAQ